MKNKHAFITGIAGFAGSYLAKELLDNGYQVSGSVYKDDSPEQIKILKKSCKLYKLDILDKSKVVRLLNKINPNYIFHLAAFASVGQSFSHERLTYNINFNGTLNILEASVELKNLQKFIFISSSDCYGTFSPKTKILTEDDRLNPLSPYGISKVAAEHLCKLYHSRYNFPVVIARAFNHSGAGQNENYVIPSFCKQIAMIEAGKQKPVMKVGDLSVKRDLSDVRDIVRGYRQMAEKGRDGRVYQLCSGKAISIQSVLHKLLKLSHKKITVKIDKKYFRKNDIPIIRGDFSRAKKEIRYKPKYKIDNTLLNSLDYWREKTKPNE